MTWLAETAMLSYGWRRALLLLFAGAVAGLSVPPLFVLPALFLAVPVWIWCLDGAESRPGLLGRILGPAFRIGFFFGLGYFVVAIHWIGAAFFVDGGFVLLLMPFAIVLLASVLAATWGVGSAVAHWFWSDSAWRILPFAAAIGAAEWVRGHLFTGFPFDLLGYALTPNEPMMQLASVIGVYGLGTLAVLLAATPALIWPARKRPAATRLLPLLAAVLVLALQFGWGSYRLGSTELVGRDDLRMRIVQPAIDQKLKWQAESRDFVLERLLTLSETRLTPSDPGLEGITHLVWPESAVPFYLSDYPDALARMARMLPDGVLLLTGAPRDDLAPGEPPSLSTAGYNAILAIDSAGEVVASYDKTHLVPFGEYLPFQEFFSSLGLRQFVPGANGWAQGSARRVFQAPNTPPFLPLICYEVLFSGSLGEAAQESQFILNVTNDAWFDGSIGPAQHFHHAVLRAVEQGLPLVRAANTGVSALVDPLGRVSARLAEREAALVDVTLTEPLPATVFARFGHLPFLGIEACLVLVGAIVARRTRRGRI